MRNDEASGEVSTYETRRRRLAERLAEGPPVHPDSTLVGLAGKVSRAIPVRLRYPIRRAATRAVEPVARRRLAEARARTPLLLHIGSGPRKKPGYVNIDLAGAAADLYWDVARGLPFDDGTVDGIFHEHVFEHLPLDPGFAFARECLRVLKPGGVMRVAVPDAGACIDSYAGNASPDWADSAPTPMMAVERLFYSYTHFAMYDSEKLRLLLEVAGFEGVTECQYGIGALAPNVDSVERRDGTLYVEGKKRQANGPAPRGAGPPR